jgi:hypothetical protein
MTKIVMNKLEYHKKTIDLEHQTQGHWLFISLFLLDKANQQFVLKSKTILNLWYLHLDDGRTTETCSNII